MLPLSSLSLPPWFLPWPHRPSSHLLSASRGHHTCTGITALFLYQTMLNDASFPEHQDPGRRDMPRGKGAPLFWLLLGDGSAFKSVTFMVRSSHVLGTRGTPQICLIQVAKNTMGWCHISSHNWLGWVTESWRHLGHCLRYVVWQNGPQDSPGSPSAAEDWGHLCKYINGDLVSCRSSKYKVTPQNWVSAEGGRRSLQRLVFGGKQYCI